jgi:hypothetical protein
MGPKGPSVFFVVPFAPNSLKSTQAPMIEEHDALIIRCPQLGGEVPFRYCRTVNEDLPCRRIMVCWEFRIEISKFLSEHYSIDQIQSALASPNKTRLDTILELIEKAKKIK